MPITLIGTRIEVEYQVGDPKGNSYNSPWTMDDIVAASDAGGWNPAVVKNGYSYYVPYSILIKGTDTWFVASYATWDRDTVIFFEPTTLNEAYCLRNNGEAHIRFGNNYRVSLPGVNIFISPLVNENKASIQMTGDLYIQNTKISRARYLTLAGNETYIAYIINCEFQQAYWGYTINNRTYIDQLKIYGNYYQLSADRSAYYSNNITLYGGSIPLLSGGYVSSDPILFKNLKILIPTGSYDTLIRVSANLSDKHIYFLDCEIDYNRMTFYWSATNYNNAKSTQYLQTTLNVEISDENGDPIDCSIKIYATDDTLLYSGELTGGILEDYALTYAYKYRRVHYGEITELDVNHQPLRVEISKTGYLTLNITNIEITPGVPTTLRGVLLEPVYYNRTLEGTITQHQLTGVIEKHEISGTIEQHTIEGVIEQHELTGDISQIEIEGEIQ